MQQDNPHILRLEDVSLADSDRVGNKAAVLGELRQGGLPVPEGICVLRPPEEGQEALFWENIERYYHQLVSPGDKVAVRSSGLNEDTPDASFAGLYKTILSVSNFQQLKAAVEECWAALDAESPASTNL